MNKVGNQIAVVLLPVLVVLIAYSNWMMWRVGHSSPKFVFLSALIGIPLLSVLLGAGFRFYRTHPFVGLLTAFSLLALFPLSQEATAADEWQLVFGLVTGVFGGAFSFLFLILSSATLSVAGEREDE